MLLPEAAIIIPHYNDPARLARCLDALLPQTTSRIEVVVVDNESHTRPAVPAPARLIIETAKGAACARNRGVLETTAPRIFFLDSDCIPDSDWIATALRVCDSADIVGGPVAVFDETPPPRSGAQAFETVFAFNTRSYVEDQGFTVTANLLTHRDVFEAAGEFRNGVSEDLDWCHRATTKGYRLRYEDSLRVSHPSRSTWKELRQKWQRLNSELGQLAVQRRFGRTYWAARAMIMPFSAIAHMPRVVFSPRLAGPGERIGAAATLIRLRCLRSAWMLSQATRSEIHVK